MNTTLPSLPAQWRERVARLPSRPPSTLLALLLDRLLLPRLDASQRQALQGQTVEIELQELGARVRLLLGERGFRAAGEGGAARLRLRARADALWRLLRGQDDADRLFFDGALVMEGDTEYGLILKNTLDAIGPLWSAPVS
ncbi:ubiquinone anaerobic biosynthesis accessory factor UbiT [Roseateles saccharophilus]|uniref:Putative lipid carrier protein YhbT n=1 Tax=Roseateles saccharophilus TaxID=304 RepID=A0A4R3V1J3_ROSSA|nr:SCP2 sterol-binding domain-containing protein [Roseateles saccharophilus]MDG0832323.1 sterol-binding protein [Roseateles saccharophilus]TCU97017.1 putative lipid carrier protein YhbT [Roseateles saccharophilus]